MTGHGYTPSPGYTRGDGTYRFECQCGETFSSGHFWQACDEMKLHLIEVAPVQDLERREHLKVRIARHHARFGLVALAFCLVTFVAQPAGANCPRKPGGICRPTTTTGPPSTTVVPTTTTQPPTTTTVVPPTVPEKITPPAVENEPYGGGDAIPVTPAPTELPHTGSTIGFLALVGLFLLAGGTYLHLASRLDRREQ